jgi:hypothetical protein
MNAKRFLIVGVSAVIFLTMSSCCFKTFGCAGTIRIEEGARYCKILTLPRPLSDADPSKSYLGIQYEFRRQPNAPQQYFFTPLAGFGDRGPFNVYRLVISNPKQIKVATKEEWENGKPVGLIPMGGEMVEDVIEGTPPPSDGRLVTTDERIFRYAGRKLEKSGDLWEAGRSVLFSSGKSHAALQSWNGWSAGKTSGDGPFFVDIYQLGTGKRIALIRGERCGITPEFVLEYTLWLTDTDFVMPFPFDRKPEILVCHFD